MPNKGERDLLTQHFSGIVLMHFFAFLGKEQQFVCVCVCILKKSYTLSVRTLVYFSKMNCLSSQALCFGCIFSWGQRDNFSGLSYDRLSPLSPLPQPVQRMSYFKGQDGGRSQVTSFYRSTPQTSRPPSRARQKGAPPRSTGKLPHQRFISPQASLGSAAQARRLLIACFKLIAA